MIVNENNKSRSSTLSEKQHLIGDSLHLKNKKLLSILEPDEIICLSITIFKFNKALKRQERNFLLTSKYLYNLSSSGFFTSTMSIFSSSFPLKRKVDLKFIKAVTYSLSSNEFVLHIPAEFDLRYTSDKRDEILRALLEALYNLGISQIPFFFKMDIELGKYTTHLSEKNKGIIRSPEGEFSMMTLENFEDFYEKKGTNMSSLNGKSSIVIPRQSIVSAPNIPISLDDFSLLKVIGRGGFGKVYLAEKKNTKKLYAIKSIKKTLIIDKGQIDNICREKNILQLARHPNVVGLEYSFQTQERIYFVMKFIQGGELFVLLRRERKFIEKRTKFYVAQLVLALEYLHSQGVIYRDLKPENVLLDSDGYLKITDFGASKMVHEEDSTTKSFIGTADYIAPEVLLRKGHGKEVDWWSLVLCLNGQ